MHAVGGFNIFKLQSERFKQFKHYFLFTLGFGFNIRGGVDHPHVGSDPGIFITTVRADSTAGIDGRLEPGDRILAVSVHQIGCVSFSLIHKF